MGLLPRAHWTSRIHLDDSSHAQAALVYTLYLTALAIWKWREYSLGKVKSEQGSTLMAMLVQSNIAYLLLYASLSFSPVGAHTICSLSGAIAVVLSIQVHLKVRAVPHSLLA